MSAPGKLRVLAMFTPDRKRLGDIVRTKSGHMDRRIDGHIDSNITPPPLHSVCVCGGGGEVINSMTKHLRQSCTQKVNTRALRQVI